MLAAHKPIACVHCGLLILNVLPCKGISRKKRLEQGKRPPPKKKARMWHMSLQQTKKAFLSEKGVI